MADERGTLEVECQRVQEEIARLRTNLAVEIEGGAVGGEESANYAGDVYEREKTLGLMRSLEDTLACIDHALYAQAAGRYGTCECCGERISPERLQALPQTTVCVRCQAEREAKAQRRARPRPLE